MNINELAKEVHENAVALGDWQTPPTLPEALCLIHLVYGTCVLAAEDCKFSCICDKAGRPGESGGIDGPCKPEGIAVELADVILRTLDLMAALGVDVDAVVMAKHKYNLAAQEIEARRSGQK